MENTIHVFPTFMDYGLRRKQGHKANNYFKIHGLSVRQEKPGILDLYNKEGDLTYFRTSRMLSWERKI